MTFADTDDEGPQDEIAFEQEEFQRQLAAHSERAMLIRAIHVANGIEQEVAGTTPGFILHYLKDMQQQAIDAIADMIASTSLTEAERIEAKLAVQPYAHLMHWLKDRVGMRRENMMKVEDLARALDEGEI